MNNNKTLIIVVVILSFIVIGLGGYTTVLTMKQNNNKEVLDLKDKEEKENATTEESEEEVENKDEYINKMSKHVYEFSSSSDYVKAYVTSDEQLVVGATDFKTQVVQENVRYAAAIQAGQTGVGSGTIIIMILNDNNVVYFNVDGPLLNGKVEIVNLTESLKDVNIADVKFIYSKPTYTNEFEPTYYRVFMVDQNNQEKEITDLFRK